MSTQCCLCELRALTPDAYPQTSSSLFQRANITNIPVDEVRNTLLQFLASPQRQPAKSNTNEPRCDTSKCATDKIHPCELLSKLLRLASRASKSELLARAKFACTAI
jgi:hypothetical protein